MNKSNRTGTSTWRYERVSRFYMTLNANPEKEGFCLALGR